MKAHTRYSVAAIATAVVNRRSISSVYCHSEKKFFSFEAKANGSRVDAYDYTRGAFVDGDLPDLYDYKDGAFIEMNVNASKCDGYDFGSGTFYECEISGNSVTLYDFGVSKFFTFECS